MTTTRTLPAPSELDAHLNAADWGMAGADFVPQLADLSWTADLFSFVENAAAHATETLDLDVLPRDWQASAFQAASDYLLYTDQIFKYAASFWQIVNFTEVAEARRWYAANAGTPTSLADPNFTEVGGVTQATVHMVITNIYLAAIRHEAERREA